MRKIAGAALAAYTRTMRLAVPRTVPSPGAVAVTFDDGPHPEGTPPVLEALAAAGAVATFYLVGEQVRRHPSLAAEIAGRGHAVGVHGDRHRLLLRVGRPRLAADLDRVRAAIEDAAGVPARLHRAPYGIYSHAALGEVRRRGWAPLLWSRWGHDWAARASPRSIADEVTADLRAGDVLLLHDADTYSAPGSHRRTAAALPLVLERIAAAGLRTVPVAGSDGDA